MSRPNLISITGGGGHLGFCLIDKLLQKGFFVKALYYSYLPNIIHSNLTWVNGNITNAESINNLIENCSTIIHCASMISVGDRNNEVVYDINVNGTKTIIESCLKKNIKLIYISSSTAVKETRKEERFDENRPYKTKNAFIYQWSKALSEQIILEAVKNHNLDAIIIRPTAIIGPPDHKPSRFGQTIADLSNGKLPVITKGGYNMVDVRDLSQTIINSISKGKQGEIYLVGGTYISLRQVSELINPNNRLICIPLQLLIAIFPVINGYNKLFSLRWELTKESLVILKDAPKNVDSSKAIAMLDHKIRPIGETIEDVKQWLSKNNSK